jgi:hypothetical protein
VSPGRQIAGSALELQEKLDAHCHLVRSVFEKTPEVDPPCARVWRLRLAIVEAIETLESTRKSFRSRKLEELRKKLVRALAECG